MELLFLALIIGSFYFLAIRPQKARLRALQQTQAALAPGVEVMTTAGLYGTVTAVGDEDVTLEVSPGVTVRFARAAIARRVDAATDTAGVADADVATDADPTTTIPPG